MRQLIQLKAINHRFCHLNIYFSTKLLFQHFSRINYELIYLHTNYSLLNKKNWQHGNNNSDISTKQDFKGDCAIKMW